MYTQFKETAKHPTLMASILGLINPVTILPILTVGIVGTLIYKSTKKSKSENQRLQTVNEALENEIEPLEEEEFEPLPPEPPTASEAVKTTVENMTDDELKKEMIRQAMSELGKRSGQSRCNKS